MYTPRRDGRIAMTSSGGGLRFTKNGTSARASMDTLQQMVADNPAAAAEARQAASDLHTGVALDFGGLAAALAGAFLIAPGTNADGTRRPVSDANLAVGGVLAVGGLVAIIGAIHYLASAQGRQLDAINIYNDALGAWPPPQGAAAPAAVVSPVPFGPSPNAAPEVSPTPLVSPLPPPTESPR